MGALKIGLALFCATALVNSSPLPKAETCGYASCQVPIEGMTNVHLIAHTHDDVGWLKTEDQYYYGHRNNIQLAGVQYIIDSVISELPKDPSRKFIYVETAYFRQWWDHQPQEIREKVEGLIESGQLEIISGGWAMHDEAVTHYQSIIDQFTWGFRTIDDMFNTTCARPKIGWQIDPFGHARETASMMAMMGFDGLFFARLDEADKRNRFEKKELELVWKASVNHGPSSYLFTSANHDFYYPPAGFCFDILCRDDPIIDDLYSPDYNVDARVDGFIEYIERQSSYMKTNNILVTMGTDFSYQQASYWYDNLDRLIKYVNERQTTADGKINLMYSTPSCYLKAVQNAGQTWTTKDDDFFPYASDDYSYWTGYFTSRPTLKFMERKGNNFLQICKQLSVLADLREEKWEDLASLREAMGIMQHHDAITGTEKQHVAEDYAFRLHRSMEHCHETTKNALNKLAMKVEAAENLEFRSCLYSNISQCDVSEISDRFVVTLYNPLAQAASPFVRLPVREFAYQVRDEIGAVLSNTQMIKIPTPVLTIPGRSSQATQELVFQAMDVPPLGFKSYHITRTTTPLQPPSSVNEFTIANEDIEITFDQDTNTLSSVRDIAADKIYSITQDFQFYKARAGTNLQPSTRASGAYIFRPLDHKKFPVSNSPPTLETYKGDLVNEIHQTWNEWISSVTRIYKGSKAIELEWTVGPIPVTDLQGKEVVTHMKLDGWETLGKFYTDSNGREVLERNRDLRPTWDFNPEFEPVAQNYYPITTTISLRNHAADNNNEEFVVITDRAQGGSSIENGTLELMLHRRLLFDDDKGVGEALNEEAFADGLVARGKHILLFGQTQDHPTSLYKQRQLTRDNMVLAPWVFLTPTTLAATDYQSKYNTLYSGLMKEVPPNVNLLTLEPWGGPDGDQILVRVEHFLEQSDDPELSTPAFVPIMGLIERINDNYFVRETTLGGNQWLEDNVRLEFKVEGEDEVSQQLPRPDPSEDATNITLNPMQIRTFIIQSRSGAISNFPNLISLAALLALALCRAFL
ncbi:lysosomal alpha-mannosidase-like [Neocloeon triangulifer]|uniref:lysosomal alpha-mannosidase-like n=1 Tax=Neocloeon triangulifer TaxID=2078957 RepID=UPI00286FAAAE|nr:lysosomal alpha-mannosidase-like [Neocloeon triangulifer]